MTTDRQAFFVSSLVKERVHALGFEDEDTAVADILARMEALDVKGASTLIDRIKSISPDPDPTMPLHVRTAARHGVNSRTQSCDVCGHVVDSGAGFYYLDGSTSRWMVCHKQGECNTAPAPAVQQVERGFYRVGDKTIMVYETKSKRLAAKELINGKYEYVKGLVYSCAHGHKLTAEEAAEYGKVHGHCIVCCRSLRDDADGKSIDRGYGPVCAKNNGWPWGNK